MTNHIYVVRKESEVNETEREIEIASGSAYGTQVERLTPGKKTTEYKLKRVESDKSRFLVAAAIVVIHIIVIKGVIE